MIKLTAEKVEMPLALQAIILDIEIMFPDKYLINYGGDLTESLSDLYARDPEQLKRRIENRAELYRQLGWGEPRQR